jgi:hypothetical protein
MLNSFEFDKPGYGRLTRKNESSWKELIARGSLSLRRHNPDQVPGLRSTPHLRDSTAPHPSDIFQDSTSDQIKRQGIKRNSIWLLTSFPLVTSEQKTLKSINKQGLKARLCLSLVLSNQGATHYASSTSLSAKTF